MRLGRRGPGLIGAAARTAVIAGTATAVSGRVAAHQQQQAMEAEAQMQAQMAPPPPPVSAPAPSAAAPADDTMAQLQQLAAMKAQGLLTDAEFTAAKARLLGL